MQQKQQYEQGKFNHLGIENERSQYQKSSFYIFG
jgi:hypothetical protein